MSHELSSAVVKDHSQAGAVGLHVAIQSIVPLQGSELHQASHIQQTVDGKSSLSQCIYVCMCVCVCVCVWYKQGTVTA